MYRRPGHSWELAPQGLPSASWGWEMVDELLRLSVLMSFCWVLCWPPWDRPQAAAGGLLLGTPFTGSSPSLSPFPCPEATSHIRPLNPSPCLGSVLRGSPLRHLEFVNSCLSVEPHLLLPGKWWQAPGRSPCPLS